MNKNDFIEKLRSGLSHLPNDEQERMISYYSEIIDDMIDEGLTEEETIGQLSMPEAFSSVKENEVNNESDTHNVLKGLYICTLSSDVYVRQEDGEDYSVELEGRRDSIKAKVVAGILVVEQVKSDCDEVTVFLPKKHYNSMKIISNNGDISVEGGFVFDNCELSSPNGNIDISTEVKKALHIRTVNGDVGLKNMSCGEVSITTVNGDASINDLFKCSGMLNIKTYSGDIDISNSNADEFRLQTRSGDVNLNNSTAKNHITIETVSGDIEIGCVDSDNLKLKTVSGDIEGSLLSPKSFNVRSRSGDVDVPFSNVGGKCDVETVSGDITIKVV